MRYSAIMQTSECFRSKKFRILSCTDSTCNAEKKFAWTTESRTLLRNNSGTTQLLMLWMTSMSMVSEVIPAAICFNIYNRVAVPFICVCVCWSCVHHLSAKHFVYTSSYFVFCPQSNTVQPGQFSTMAYITGKTDLSNRVLNNVNWLVITWNTLLFLAYSNPAKIHI